jgi:hypothetical protein
MSLTDDQWLFAQDVSALIWHVQVEHPDWSLTFGEVWRPSLLQQVYQKLGLSWTSRSLHIVRMAVDFNLFIAGVWITDASHPAFRELGQVWEDLSEFNLWGVWKGRKQVDAGHFERRHFPRPIGYAWPA